MTGRYVTDLGARTYPESTPSTVEMEADAERYRLMRLCPCDDCSMTGKDPADGRRCRTCRGEGRQLQEVATCGTMEAVGVALVTLAREGEFDCPFGLIDRRGETGKKWLVKPWPASPRTVSDAARTLARSKNPVTPS